MDHGTIDALRDRHPAWRLLRAQHAFLVLSFLGSHAWLIRHRLA